MSEIKISTSEVRPNSHKSKEKERLEPVVRRDKIASTEKPLGKKLASSFVQEDLKEVRNYIFWEVIIPGIKDTLLDLVEMAFYGSTSGNRHGRSGSSSRRNDSNHTDYRSSYTSSSRSRRERERKKRDDKLDYQSIVLLERSDCEDVVRTLHQRIKKYGAVSIAELFDLIDEPSDPNDNNWGWTDPRDIGVRSTGRGFLIDVAEAEYLD